MSGGGLGRWRTPLLVAVVAVGALLRLAVFDHHRAVDFDEGRYLDNAVNLMKGRGLATHYTSHFFRPVSEAPPLHPEDISAPLFPWLLAGTFAVTGPELRPAQLWGLVPGCMMIWLTFLLGERLFDQRVALLAGMLVALNPDMTILSSWAMTESLYGTMLLGILLLAARAAARGRGSGGGADARRWAAAGLACGLLYLLRANGLAVAAGLGLAALWPAPGESLWRPAAGLRRRLAAAAILGLCFAACVTPWLIRNQRVFGSPTWTAMKHVAWTESGKDLFRRDGPPPSLQTFRARHGDAALAENLALRAWRAARYLVWGDTGAYNAICLLYPIALVLTWRTPAMRAGHLVVLLSAALLFGVPTWTGALSRYMLPLRPWIYLSVIGAAVQLAPGFALRSGRAGDAGRAEPARRLALAAAATLVALIGWGSSRPLRAVMQQDETSRDLLAREASRWIATHTPDDAVLMEGATLHQYAFLFDRAVVWTPAGDLDDARRAAADYGARYLVVSAELLRFRPDLDRHFDVSGGAVRARDLPAGFEEVFAGAGRRYVIWRFPEGPA